MISYRDLTTLEDFARVVELERVIWGPGYTDVVPVPILAVTVMRGGILIGAFADDPGPTRGSRAGGPDPAPTRGSRVWGPDRLVGFVYSLPAIRHGKPSQWSHMLGVIDEHRNDGLGRRLKMMQRDRALAMGIDLIEWTFDPMQALNAHLNLTVLGVEIGEYEENVYGESASPLHRGNPTDRFVAEWWIRADRRAHDPSGAASVNEVVPSRTSPGEPGLLACGRVDLDCRAAKLTVAIPTGFTEMLAADPALALEWRLATRRIFGTYLGRGYRVVGFSLDRGARLGRYLLGSSNRAAS